VVTYTEGRYEGMGQNVERERIVSKKADVTQGMKWPPKTA